MSNALKSPHALRRQDSELIVIRSKNRDHIGCALERALDLARSNPSADWVDVAYSLSKLGPKSGCCLAMVASDLNEFVRKAEHARKRLSKSDCVRIQDRSGIFFTQNPLASVGGVGFMFPGEGCQYPDMLKELCFHFPEVRHEFDLVDRACQGSEDSFTPSAHIFSGPLVGQDDTLWNMGAAVESVSAADSGLMRIFQGLDLEPDAVVGHSSGEFVALEMAGVLRFKDDEAHVELIRNGYENIRSLGERTDIPEGTLIAVGAVTEDKIQRILARYPSRVLLAMHNCPHQFVLCAEPSLVEELSKVLAAEGALVQVLPFNRPYHTPWFEPAIPGIQSLFKGQTLHAPTVNLYSCATASRFPDDEERIRELCIQQWASRVRFDETIRAMYKDGIRIFMDIGPRGNLAAFVADILKGEPHLAVAVNRQHRSSMTQLHHALGMIVAHGVSINLDFLFCRREARQLDSSSRDASSNTSVILKPELPLLQIADIPVPKATASDATKIQLPLRSGVEAVPPNTARPVPMASTLSQSQAELTEAMKAYFDTMDDFISVQHQLVSGFLSDEERIDPEDPSKSSTA